MSYRGPPGQHGMRPLILKMDLSLDGFCGTPDGDVEWVFRSFDDEFARATVELLGRAGVHVMGGVLYGDMAAHWPTSDEPFAAPMNDNPKVVFARGDLSEEIAALKAEDGGPILAHGGARLAQDLSRRGLVDEYELTLHPDVLGRGLPIFADPAQLRLTGTRTYAAGAVTLRYERA
jgi:dihydrofolate reductase